MAMAMAMATATTATKFASPYTAIATLASSKPPSCASFASYSPSAPWRLHCRPHAARRRVSVVARAEAQAETTTVAIKDFLEDLKPVGRTRVIVNTGVAVLESTVPNLDKLFYHVMPGRGEYANLMMKEENVDFHLLIDKVASANLETGKSMRGDIPTYMIRLKDHSGAVAVSLLVMWKPGSDGDFSGGQVEAYQNLLTKYGSDITFAANSSE